MNKDTADLTKYLGTLITLGAVTITLSVISGDADHALVALAGLLTFAGTQRPPTAAQILPLVAIGVATTLSGCGASAGETVPLVVGGAQVVVAGVCEGAEKLCEQDDPACSSGACHAFHSVCPVLAPTSPVQITCNVVTEPAP